MATSSKPFADTPPEINSTSGESRKPADLEIIPGRMAFVVYPSFCTRHIKMESGTTSPSDFAIDLALSGVGFITILILTGNGPLNIGCSVRM